MEAPGSPRPTSPGKGTDPMCSGDKFRTLELLKLAPEDLAEALPSKRACLKIADIAEVCAHLKPHFRGLPQSLARFLHTSP